MKDLKDIIIERLHLNRKTKSLIDIVHPTGKYDILDIKDFAYLMAETYRINKNFDFVDMFLSRKETEKDWDRLVKHFYDSINNYDQVFADPKYNNYMSKAAISRIKEIFSQYKDRSINEDNDADKIIKECILKAFDEFKKDSGAQGIKLY